MDWGIGDFSLGSGFNGIDLSTIDTATPPLADVSNGSPGMQASNWLDMNWISGALDKALNYSIAKDERDYQRQVQQQVLSLQQMALYNQRLSMMGAGQVGGSQPLSTRQIIVFGAIGLGILLMSKSA